MSKRRVKWREAREKGANKKRREQKKARTKKGANKKPRSLTTKLKTTRTNEKFSFAVQSDVGKSVENPHDLSCMSFSDVSC